jgi:hypothetical protein
VLGRLTTLRRYAQSLTRHDVDAEDLVHDALVRAYEKRATFHAGGNQGGCYRPPQCLCGPQLGPSTGRLGASPVPAKW